MDKMNLIKSFLAAAVAGGIALSANAQDYATIVEAGSGGLLQSTNFSMVGDPRGNGGTSAALGTSTTGHIWGNLDAGGVDMTFSFTPGVTASNAGSSWDTSTQLGADLNGDPIFAAARPDLAGQSGLYNVYFTHVWTDNISQLNTFTITSDGSDVVHVLNMNSGTTVVGGQAPQGLFAAGQWGLLATVDLTAGQTYTVNMTAPSGWVSHRTHGVMFEAIPEPSTYAAIFGGLALLGAFVYRRRLSVKK